MDCADGWHATYEHDVDGFLTSKTEYPTGGGPAETTAYEYSSRGELLRVMLSDGRTVEYEHDPLGRRVAKKIDGATVEKYLWAGMTELLAVYDGSGSLKYRFEGAKVVTTSGTLYMLTDQVGTVRALVSSDGSLVKTIAYDSFGNILAESNPSMDFPLGFAGGLYDEDTGLVRFGYRDYDPETGRWTAKDPIGFLGGGTNQYAYCSGNPISLSDPSGCYEWGAFFQGFGSSLSDTWYSMTHVTAPDAAERSVWGQASAMSSAYPVEGYGAKIALGTSGVAAGAALALMMGESFAPFIDFLGQQLANAPDREPVLPDDAWDRRAPRQVEPGVRAREHLRYNPFTGEPEISDVYYDDYGRQVERVDYTDHGRPDTHPNPHYHPTIYGPGYGNGWTQGPLEHH